ncbi:hypothetical protein P3T73_12555 [Kiritimatiellota bacterium B12222]|nr:hypothetical protein P3T73_12555 [Kiritimatiellota bacterium B12222]
MFINISNKFDTDIDLAESCPTTSSENLLQARNNRLQWVQLTLHFLVKKDRAGCPRSTDTETCNANRSEGILPDKIFE